MSTRNAVGIDPGTREQFLMSCTRLVLIVAVGLVGAACQSVGEPGTTVRLDREGTTEPVPVPVEIEGNAALESDASAVRIGTGDESVGRLQWGLALFGSETAPLDSAWVGLLPAGLVSGEHLVASGDTSSAFAFEEEDGRLTVLEQGAPVFAYNFGEQRPEGVPEAYHRAGYVHPVWSPTGTVLTDDFPEDHYHHRGVSWMWPRVQTGGEEYDLWHLEGVRQVFDQWLVRRAGPNAATMGAKVHWETETDTIVDERIWIRAFPARQGTRALDVRLTLEATEQPVTLLGQSNQDKGYGGFSFRYAPRDSTVIVSPDGRAEDSNHQRFRWADETGRFGGADHWEGAAIFQHPSHPRFPVQWTLRHYGFLGVAWPGNDGAALVPGEPVTLRYRVWLHEGDAEEGRVEAAYDAFVNPPVLSGGAQ